MVVTLTTCMDPNGRSLKSMFRSEVRILFAKTLGDDKRNRTVLSTCTLPALMLSITTSSSATPAARDTAPVYMLVNVFKYTGSSKLLMSRITNLTLIDAASTNTSPYFVGVVVVGVAVGDQVSPNRVGDIEGA